MANDNDIVVRSDRNGGKVHLSADRVYDLTEDKTQDTINGELRDIAGTGQLSGFPSGVDDLTEAANSLKTTLNDKADKDGSNITNESTWLTALGVNTNFPNVSSIAVTGITYALLSTSLHNFTGTIPENLSGKITGNVLLISGRVRISVTARTGSNGGIRCTLPNNKVINSSFNVSVGISAYSDGPRNGESTIIKGNAGDNYFDIYVSESFANISADKIVIMYVPPTIIELKDGT